MSLKWPRFVRHLRQLRCEFLISILVFFVLSICLFHVHFSYCFIWFDTSYRNCCNAPVLWTILCGTLHPRKCELVIVFATDQLCSESYLTGHLVTSPGSRNRGQADRVKFGMTRSGKNGDSIESQRLKKRFLASNLIHSPL